MCIYEKNGWHRVYNKKSTEPYWAFLWRGDDKKGGLLIERQDLENGNKIFFVRTEEKPLILNKTRGYFLKKCTLETPLRFVTEGSFKGAYTKDLSKCEEAW